MTLPLRKADVSTVHDTGMSWITFTAPVMQLMNFSICLFKKRKKKKKWCVSKGIALKNGAVFKYVLLHSFVLLMRGQTEKRAVKARLMLDDLSHVLSVSCRCAKKTATNPAK